MAMGRHDATDIVRLTTSRGVPANKTCLKRSFGLKKSRPTEESDYYAPGMVIYEVLSGQTPFTQYSSLAAVRRILNSEGPGRPQGKEGELFSDAL
ncbi:hypothetical protein BDM02DRAFT_3173166 [Thelephora ganbajun]|uniref:Uncharacterized protein n=1 Tax=Thelephora ganbajun TaxID=370292 RepID=A0ACB6Z6Z1_THEGA|nr:hypothetical protein BDM02DRAFT_3173166 [Thelephora ganbajun]